MNATTVDSKTVVNPAGVLLRQWRDVRGKTQLDLSLDAGVSQKHIGFVESGRRKSTPHPRGKLAKILGHDIPVALCLEVVFLQGAVFGRTRDEGGL